MSDSIRISNSSGVCEISLDRPNTHNAFDDKLVAELTEALKAATHDASVWGVVLTGEGKTFSAGADANWMRSMANASELENRNDALRLAELMRTLNFLPKPTVARVNGSAYGGGVGLIACCDIAIGIDDAKFSLSEAKLGLVPAVISPYVIAAIGLRQARRLFVSGEIIDGEEAFHIGLLHRALSRSDLDDAVARALHFLRKCGANAQAEAKALALRVAGLTPESALKLDTENASLIARLRVSEEGQEGLTAFLEKRPPRWVSEG